MAILRGWRLLRKLRCSLDEYDAGLDEMVPESL
jgi:hypothetical protein